MNTINSEAEIRRVAAQCVGRAVMFGSLAIGCVMIGFSFDPASSFRSGAVLTLLLALVLVAKAMSAGSKHPRHTEVWLYLDQKARPMDEAARVAFGSVMREVYGAHALIAFGIAVAFFVVSWGVALFVPSQ